MFERILVPLDGTESAEIAIPYAEELANGFAAEVILYHVYGREHQKQKHMHQVYLDTLAEAMRQNMRKGEGKDIEIKVATKVESGQPAENICNLVNKNKVDLIVMAAVSSSGLKTGKMLGSVADHICRTVPAPVLFIRPGSFHRIEGRESLITQILIPLDGSELSKLALPVGEEIAVKLKVPITLFQMANLAYSYAGHDYVDGINFTRINEREEQMIEENYAQLNEGEERRVLDEMIALENKLRAKGLTVTRRVISGTDAAHEIIQAGKEVNADLTVMSTHGRSGLDKLVLGSVAEKVLRHGEIPLLLVNARAG